MQAAVSYRNGAEVLLSFFTGPDQIEAHFNSCLSTHHILERLTEGQEGIPSHPNRTNTVLPAPQRDANVR